LSPRGGFSVIPAQAGIQAIQLIASWIAQKRHFVSHPPPSRGQARGNEEGRVLS
jgi:hypothetical protein